MEICVKSISIRRFLRTDGVEPKDINTHFFPSFRDHGLWAYDLGL